MNSVIFELYHNEDDEISKILDPSAWARKYFNIASASWNLFDIFINGMNDNILISRAVHVIIQLFLEIAIKVLIIIVEYKIFDNGDEIIYMKI